MRSTSLRRIRSRCVHLSLAAALVLINACGSTGVSADSGSTGGAAGNSGRAGAGGLAGATGTGGQGDSGSTGGGGGRAAIADGGFGGKGGDGSGGAGGCARACNLSVSTVQNLCLHTGLPPAAEGGSVQSGTYNLIGVDSYSLSDAGTSSCFDGYYQGAIIVAGDSWIRSDGTRCAVEQGTFVVSGTVLTISNQCLISGTASHSFTATASSIVLYDGSMSQTYSRP